MNQTNILFVDVDGTLTGTESGKLFKQHPKDVKPLPGSQAAITHFANRGFKIFGLTNQGGCDTINRETGKPFKTIKEVIEELQYTLSFYPEIDIIYFCPSMSGDTCHRVTRDIHQDVTISFWQGLYRKPDVGMVNEIIYACDAVGFIGNNSLFVGDRDEDRECAKEAGINFIDAEAWRFQYGSFVSK